jgi:hypothetical protein
MTCIIENNAVSPLNFRVINQMGLEIGDDSVAGGLLIGENKDLGIRSIEGREGQK